MNKIEGIQDWIDELIVCNKLIIVEGLKDKNSLNCLGTGRRRIVILNKPLYQIVESVAAKTDQVIILTDFDKKGKELYGRLKKDFNKFGVKVDRFFREWLQRNTKISHVEGLARFVRRNYQE